jgi:hypothetical protein
LTALLTILRLVGLIMGLGPEGGVPVGVGLTIPAGVGVSETWRKASPSLMLVAEGEAPGCLEAAGVFAGLAAAVTL